MGIHAGDIDDFSLARLNHRLGCKLRKQEAGIEVRLNDLIPVLWSLIEDTPTSTLTAMAATPSAEARS
jgi:hypothetical protein